jgi:predicted CXXCH cytochrome family protein
MASDLTIEHTKHNFGANGFSWASGEICKPCHTPHHAAPESVSKRLWNHALTDATYSLKAGTGEPTSGAAVDVLDRTSRMCMSCHDGTVAVDAFGGATGTTKLGLTRANLSNSMINNEMVKGATNDLTNDHPVGIYAAYDTTKGHYNTAVTGSNGRYSVANRVGSMAGSVSLYDFPTGTMYAGKAGVYMVSCYTCHNPHGSNIAVDGEPNKHLLRVTSDGSELCLTCHNK